MFDAKGGCYMLRVRSKEDLSEIARKMFQPVGKEPYYLGGKAIRNLEELKNSLNEFGGTEGGWVASWIEYLGDSETANKIRASPKDFKKIISERYTQLKKYKK